MPALTAPAAPTLNASRFRPGRDHVESWFLRANHPDQPRALWIKATVLASRRGLPSGSGSGASAASASLWCCSFDGDRAVGQRVVARRTTVPLAQASLDGDQPRIRVADSLLQLGSEGGQATGNLPELSWDLRWDRLPGAMGQPLCLFPSTRLIDSRLPSNKLVTPFPALRLAGRVVVAGEVWPVAGWVGMQGHNWGPAHSPEYVWGQCNFLAEDGDVACSVEAASGRVVVGGITTPALSMMCVRRGKASYRFDRIVDVWRQSSHSNFPRWTLGMRGSSGQARLTMQAEPDSMICLPYENPSGQVSACLNSKLARVSLTVNPVNEDAFSCSSTHGGALEFLQPQPQPGVMALQEEKLSEEKLP